MAIEAKELELIVAKLAEAITPKIKEIEASTLVRFEAATQAFRDEFNPKLAELSASLKGLSEVVVLKEEVAVLADQIKAVENSVDAASGSLSAMVADEITAVKLEQAKGQEELTATLDRVQANVAENLNTRELVWDGKLDKVKAQVSEEVAEVRAAIPELPEPAPLVIDGELSPELQKATEIIITQVVTPLVLTSVDGAMKHCDEFALKTAQRVVEGLEATTAEKFEALNCSTVDNATAVATVDNVIKSLTLSLTQESHAREVLAKAIVERFKKTDDTLQDQLAGVNSLAVTRTEKLAEELKEAITAQKVNLEASNAALAAKVAGVEVKVVSLDSRFEAQVEYTSTTTQELKDAVQIVVKAVDAEAVSRAAAIESVSERMAANVVTLTEDLNAVSLEVDRKAYKSVEETWAKALNEVRSLIEAEAVNRAAAVEGVQTELDTLAPRAELVEVASRIEEGLRNASDQLNNVMQSYDAKLATSETSAGARTGELLLALETLAKELRGSVEELKDEVGASVEGVAADMAKTTEIFLGKFKQIDEAIAVNREALRTSLFEEMKEFFTKGFLTERVEVQSAAHKAALEQVEVLVADYLVADAPGRLEQVREVSIATANTAAIQAAGAELAKFKETLDDSGAKAITQVHDFVSGVLDDFKTTQSAVLLEATAEKATSVAVQTAVATLEQQMPEIEKSLHDKFVQLGDSAVQTAAAQVPDLVKKEIPEIVAQVVASASDELKEQAVEVSKATTTKLFAELEPRVYISSATTAKVDGSAAGKSAAESVLAEALPGMTKQVQAAVLADAALAEAARTAGGEAASVVAQAAGAATLAEATTLAGAAAKAASEAAAATVEANLRATLAAELDPAPKLQGLLDLALPGVLADATKSAEQAATKAVDELETRVEVHMSAKLNSAVERIPVPRDGRDGRDGKDGVNGVNGVNGKFSAPVPHIEGKTYGPGELVVSNGGLFYSLRSTDRKPDDSDASGLDWQCVLNGIANLEPVLEQDGRTVSIHTKLSDGTFKKSALTLPIPVARGLYKEGNEYSAKDLVLYDGSWWEAQRSGSLARPGEVDSGWKLQIKHGKDGRAGKDAAPASWKYRGAWVNEELYEAGDLVEHTGVHWMALRSTRERPPFSKLVSNETWLKLNS